MHSLQPHLDALLKSLPPAPVDQSKLDEVVKRALEGLKDDTRPDTRKLQWEHVLREDIFKLAATEGVALKKGAEEYYAELLSKLDLCLTFTEHDACEVQFPLYILQDVMDIQTIQSCSHVFSWIESRSARLTKDMVPQKGKALVLLRTLNELLRRLSKMGANTVFCGRILTFLSGVFPLGERSGVNLRGEYGPAWEPVQFHDKSKHNEEDGMKVDAEVPSIPEEEKMQVDGKKELTEEEKKEEVYNTFWSLQTWFSRPPLFVNKGTIEEFKEAVTKVIPIIKEATAKERAMMGSRSTAGGNAALKRKREDEEETNLNEYFFAKFLTSPDLLDLEIADMHFRRQILFQLLVLLNYLLSFTPAAKTAWVTGRNRSLQLDFTLEEQDAKWVSDTVNKVLDELKQTAPNGRVFADTVSTILDREKNWVKWKSELCTPFDKEPYSEEVDGKMVGLFEATAQARRDMWKQPPEWKYKYGTAQLTEIWEGGYKDLESLEFPQSTGDVYTFVKKTKLENFHIEKREKVLAAQLAAKSAPPPAPTPPPSAPTPVPSITVGQPDKPETSSERPADIVPGLVAPRPVPANSSLHPSLPPKPSGDSAETAGSAATSPAPQPAPAPVPAPEKVPTPAPVPEKPVRLSLDPQIARLEENKVRWAWLGLRSARDVYLQHFGKIGAGDIELLVAEIEKDKADKERALNGEATLAPEGATAEDNEGMSPAPPAAQPLAAIRRDGDGDAKMDTT